MRYRIRVADRAATQIREAADWWWENRPKAPEAMTEEIERGFDLAGSTPGIGERVAHRRLKEVRRLLLGRVRYHLYYRVLREEGVVEILALWHTSRGTRPKLAAQEGATGM